MDADVPLLEQLLGRPAWMRDALCREHPHLPWIPGDGQKVQACRAVCARCVVATECLQFALEHGAELVGVFGGTTSVERQRIRLGRAA